MEFLSNNFITDFFVIVMNFIYSLIKDYSLAIIILTFLMRAILLPLDIRQKKSSRLMAQIGPELESLKKRYANNPQLLQKKTKELQNKRGVKPMAGCLPLLIQLPIFFAFFGAMRVLASEQTVNIILNAAQFGPETTHLPTWLWIHNFWQPDSGLAGVMPNAQEFASFVQTNATYLSPQTMSLLQNHGLISFADGVLSINDAAYTSLVDNIIKANNLVGYNNGGFVLPVVSGGLLFVQQKIMMKNQPQMQQQGGGKMMLWFMPIFSIYICVTSNTAFTLYWIASSAYSLIQQLILEAVFKKQERKKEGVKVIVEEAKKS